MRKINFIIQVLSLLYLLQDCKSEVYTSLHRTNQLFVIDKEIGLLLDKLKVHDQYTTKYQNAAMLVTIDADNYGGDILSDYVAGHSLHIYSLFKRLVKLWPGVKAVFLRHIREKLLPLSDEDNIQNIFSLVAKTRMPDEGDLRGAASALARLSRTYRIYPDDFTEGSFYGVDTSIKLDFEDCLLIGEMSVRDEYFAEAIIWMEHAVYIGGGIVKTTKAQKRLAEVHALHNERWVADNSRFFPNLTTIEEFQYSWDEEYYQLCRGMDLQNPAARKNLKCYFSNQGSLFLLLQPVKVEIIIHDPQILLFHDVISDEEIEYIKIHSEDMFEPPRVLKENSRDTKVFQTTWMTEREYRIARDLSRRISEITGLATREEPFNTMEGEPLEIRSYGIGGQFSYHMDLLYKDLPEENWKMQNPELLTVGDRLATWKFYLSDVSLGGNTAFLNARVAVTPKKGSAVFWYNLTEEGYPDPRVAYACCPVLIGKKLVATKWIREKGNVLNNPCPLQNKSHRVKKKIK